MRRVFCDAFGVGTGGVGTGDAHDNVVNPGAITAMRVNVLRPTIDADISATAERGRPLGTQTPPLAPTARRAYKRNSESRENSQPEMDNKVSTLSRNAMSVMVGQPAPDFEVQAYDRTKDGSDAQFKKVKLGDFKGKWVCLYFYPLDFTFVCPTEIVAFNKALADFEDRNTVVLTASTDSAYSHKGWCDSHNDLKGLKHLMLADTTHALSESYGVLKADAGIAYRGIFLIDPKGIVRWMAVHDLSVGRNVDEVIRVLDALQTDKLCPCNWKSGEKTLN